MDHREQFKAGLLRMAQSGTLQELLGCADGGCAKVEFHLSRSYHVHLNRTSIVIHERDTEIIRRHRNKRWRRYRPTVHHRSRLVIDRASGRIVHHSHLGTSASAPQRQTRSGVGRPLRTSSPN